jgi:drug/metabolite transporter (DMT)-like permease
MTTAFLFIFLAVIFTTAARVVVRYILRETEPYAFSLLTQIIDMIIWLPFALAAFSWPADKTAWIVLIAGGILWGAVSLCSNIALKGTELSLKEPLTQSKVLWGMLIAVFFLHEQPSVYRIIGTIIIFIGVSTLLWHPERKFGSLRDSGVKWTLGTAVIAAITSAIDKYALTFFDPAVYGFFVYLIPGVVLSFFLRGRTQHIGHLLKKHGKIAIAAILMSTIGYYFTLRAYNAIDFTIAYPLLQLSTLLTVVGGIVLLKEHKHLWQRITATAIIVAGAILVGF